MENARIRKKTNFYLYGYSTVPVLLLMLYYCRTVLSGNIWLALQPEPKQGTKVEPEPKINNFGCATLLKSVLRFAG